MPRPSRHQDRALLAAGRALLPSVGCRGLTIRRVSEAAGVNAGMFHYHFGTREVFLRSVMQGLYEEMYSRLSVEVARPGDTSVREHLRAALRVLGRFLRDHRELLARVLADALSGERVAREFLRDNLPRHLGLLRGLAEEGMRRGELVDLPVAQAVGVCAGAVAFPILGGGAIAASGALPRKASRMLAEALLTDTAIDQRIEVTLRALEPPGPIRRRAVRGGRKGRK